MSVRWTSRSIPASTFYQYSCGGWKKANPIPPDRIFLERYAKLYEDNLVLLRVDPRTSGGREGSRRG